MRQGEIYELMVGGSRYRVLIVSSDAHNQGRTPWVAPVRHGRADLPPYLIAMHDADPLGDAIDLDRLRRAAPAGEPIATITGATLARVRDAIATVFAD